MRLLLCGVRGWEEGWEGTDHGGVNHHNQIKSVKPPDVGFLCVSQKVHTEDTTDGLAVVHKNGPRYIPSANSSSSNRCKLASVIMAFKTSHGSNRSRKNKAKKSYLKRRKQDACLNLIIPSSVQIIAPLSDWQMALWQIMGMEASVNKHKPVTHIMAPTTLLIS